MFKLVKVTKKDLNIFDKKINSLFVEMQKYKIEIAKFEYLVKNLNPANTHIFEALIERNLKKGIL